MTSRMRKRLVASAGLSLATGSLLSLMFLADFLSTAQLRATDVLFRSRAPERARATVIVGVDQRSYRELLPRHGTMVNWSRALYADAITRLKEAGARVIVLDLFFDAPKPEDHEVAEAIRRAGNVLTPVEAQGPRGADPPPGVAQTFDAFVRPTERIRRSAAGEGFVNVTMDQDGVVRGIPLILETDQEQVPALALAAVSHFVRRPAVLDSPATDTEVFGAGRTIPSTRGARLVINFLGPPWAAGADGSLPIIPFVDILSGAFDRSLVHDKMVLIGLTVRGLDEVSTPTAGEVRMWGVEVLANAIETILGQRYLVQVTAPATIGLIFAMTVLAGLSVAMLRPVRATLVSLGALLLYLMVATVLFDNGLILDLVHPPAALALTFAATLVFRVRTEQAEQRQLRDVMARYLSPSVSQWVLHDPGRLKLGGETRTMTVLFSDVRSFTTLAHGLAPQALVSLLNEYMTAMTEVVFRHDGVLDKYIGDGLMAFWNAPMDQPDHARRACQAALDMIQRVRGLHADWEARGLPKLDLGVGVNTGPMVVGNMGSRERLSYTVLGDTVNVASRLEGLSKEYGVRLVIGEGTRAAAGGAFDYRFLDVVAVKGRAEPLAVHEILGPSGTVDAERKTMLDRFERGVELYRSRRWEEAAEWFREAQRLSPTDGPSSLYLRRCLSLIEQPPPSDWNGVYVATRK